MYLMCLMYLCAVFHSCYIILRDAETFSIQGVIVSNAMVTAAFRQNILKCIPKGVTMLTSCELFHGCWGCYRTAT